MKYELRDFQASDLLELTPRGGDRPDMEVALGYDAELLNGSVYGLTGLLDGNIIGLSGVVPLWHGRVQAFAFYGLGVTQRDFSFIFRSTKRWLDETQKKAAFRRVEATVLTSFEKAHNFARHLGFKAEGEMEAYDLDGRTHTLYSRIRHGSSSTLLGR